jgi:predicted metal-binding membrane protein
VSALGAHRGMLGASAVLFAAAATVTVIWCGSMASMPGMEMPGGWSMSMAWMRMPGQSWLAAAATFIGMWSVMMVAMMLPVLVPMLARYQAAVIGNAGTPLAQLTMIVAAAYFSVWVLCGAVVFAAGHALAELAMRTPALSAGMPIAGAVVLALSGILQWTDWKRRELACCRTARPYDAKTDAGRAWRHGLRLGVHCLRCCAGHTAALLVVGIMDLRVMAVVTTLIVMERLAPAGIRVARASGIAAFMLIVVW